MNPTGKAILLATAAGTGWGLLVLLGAFASGEMIPDDRRFGLAALALALGAASLGAAADARDPGRPEAPLGGLSRWRSSRAARAGVLAAAAWVPAGLFALGWAGYGAVDGLWRVCGLAAAVLAGFAVHAAATTRAARLDLPRWCGGRAVTLQFALALYGGALWLHALLALAGSAGPQSALAAVATLFVSFYLKRRYWRIVDAALAAAPEGRREAEGGIARAREVTLRRYAFVLLFALPLVVVMAGAEAAPWLAALAAAAAALSGSAGAAIERRLFFAEAARIAALAGDAETG